MKNWGRGALDKEKPARGAPKSHIHLPSKASLTQSSFIIKQVAFT